LKHVSEHSNTAEKKEKQINCYCHHRHHYHYHHHHHRNHHLFFKCYTAESISKNSFFYGRKYVQILSTFVMEDAEIFEQYGIYQALLPSGRCLIDLISCSEVSNFCAGLSTPHQLLTVVLVLLLSPVPPAVSV
jgi:hypothetical protein